GNSIVDWVFAQLHRSSDNVVMSTRAVLLQRDGDVVDVDGTGAVVNQINFAGELAGNYYVSIRHRNHLGVRSAGLLGLLRTSTTVMDFRSALASAMPASGNNAMVGLSGGVFGLW